MSNETTKPPAVTRTTTMPSRCPKCQSTKRSRYVNVQRIKVDTLGPDRRPVTELVMRRTTCQTCGQRRVDHSYGYEPTATASK